MNGEIDLRGRMHRLALQWVRREVGRTRHPVLTMGAGAERVALALSTSVRMCVHLELDGDRSSRLDTTEALDRYAGVRGRPDALPFDEGTFQAVICLDTLGGVRTRAAIRELLRVLRPGGVLVVGFPNALNAIVREPLRALRVATGWLLDGTLPPPARRAGAVDPRDVCAALQDGRMLPLSLAGVDPPPSRASPGLSAVERALGLPGLSRLSPWLRRECVWAWQRPHIDARGPWIEPSGGAAEAVARG